MMSGARGYLKPRNSKAQDGAAVDDHGPANGITEGNGHATSDSITSNRSFQGVREDKSLQTTTSITSQELREVKSLQTTTSITSSGSFEGMREEKSLQTADSITSKGSFEQTREEKSLQTTDMLPSEASFQPMELITPEGSFQQTKFQKFATATELEENKAIIVSIMGPTISGKSTLVNQLFNTEFSKLPADSSKREKTTKGVWLDRARESGLEKLFVLDLEGTDEVNRQQKDHTAFEQRTALLALVVSDFVLINIWYNDIGRENGASVPLLRAALQAFRTKFASLKEALQRETRTTLLIVIRDSPNSKEEQTDPGLKIWLREAFEKIWRGPEGSSTEGNLEDYFNIKVVDFPSFKLEHDAFSNKAEYLRREFKKAITKKGKTPNDLLELETPRATILGVQFLETLTTIWKSITLNSEFHLRTKVTTSNSRFDKIFRGKRTELQFDETLTAITSTITSAMTEVTSTTTTGSYTSSTMVNGAFLRFTEEVKDWLESKYLSSFENVSDVDKETKWSYLVDFKKEARQKILPAYQRILSVYRGIAVTSFKTKLNTWSSTSTSEPFADAVRRCKGEVMSDFEKQFPYTGVEYFDHWTEVSKTRAELLREIDIKVSSVQREKTDHIFSVETERVTTDITFVNSITTSLEAATHDTWFKVRKQLTQVVERTQMRIRASLTAFDLDEITISSFFEQLERSRKDIVRELAKKQASQDKIIQHMIRRFGDEFKRNSYLTSEQQGPIQAIVQVNVAAEKARAVALKVLFVFAVIQLDEAFETNAVERELAHLLFGEKLTGRSWKGISWELTLLKPFECFNIWSKFLNETEPLVVEKCLKYVSEPGYGWPHPNPVVWRLADRGFGQS